MSEILDALKRSEAARLGDDAIATPMPAPVWHASKPRPIWPWLAVLAVIGVALAGTWQNRRELWPDRFPPLAEVDAPAASDSNPSGSKQPANPPALAASARKPAELQRQGAAPEPVPAPPSPAPSGSAAENSAADIQPDPSAPAYVAELAPIPAPAPVPPSPVSQPPMPAEPGALPTVTPTNVTAPNPSSEPLAPAVNADASLAVEPPAVSVDPNVSAMAVMPTDPPQNQSMPVDAANPAMPPDVASANPDDLLPRYEDLPYSLRHDLPPVKFSMHRYAADPNQRFVVYKERRISDNGVLDQDLWLKRVLPDGAVLEFRGTEFRVGRD
ncbi:hypothetical protein C7S18_20590 [Ahniella affigens]|uniref:Type II secretion system protein GspB C-terminal domain-containing protein n=1 Tax=Ahniella affigens TaxID=2021234 RepID=A0A2P1PX45_9GAMM|nr:general secretion pathway protein GspB [Ahniella affigens]AVP99419.1 hypothetical protein C7S18_20590 [Ahniella affigens]